MSGDRLAQAIAFCDEIERNEKELIDSGWGGYQWEHLGDATKDIHALIAYVRDLAEIAKAAGETARIYPYEGRLCRAALARLDSGATE